MIDAQQAFDLLVVSSQRRNVTLRELADRVAREGALSDDDPGRQNWAREAFVADRPVSSGRDREVMQVNTGGPTLRTVPIPPGSPCRRSPARCAAPAPS